MENVPPETPGAPEVPKNNINFLSKRLLVVAAVVTVVIVGLIVWQWPSGSKPLNSTVSKTQTSAVAGSNQTAAKVQGLQLVPNKNYSNKYADGILPVGDGKYQTSGPKTGYIYACSNYAKNLATDNGGANVRGPWWVGTAKYDINKKISVQGSVLWQAEFSNKLNGDTRTIVTNDLPDHKTGVFPISSTDPAYLYDRNPNSIVGQTLTYNLSANPAYGQPHCMSGQSGIMLTGVVLLDGLDAGGRDAGAWEVQDGCQGHPQSSGVYHYHTLSSCIKNISVKTVIGFALDGFPITGPEVGKNNILTTADLDECHGLTSQIVLDGKNVTSYHYVMTEDFPYSISCFRAAPIQPPTMGGQQQNTSNTLTGGGSGTITQRPPSGPGGMRPGPAPQPARG